MSEHSRRTASRIVAKQAASWPQAFAVAAASIKQTTAEWRQAYTILQTELAEALKRTAVRTHLKCPTLPVASTALLWHTVMAVCLESAERGLDALERGDAEEAAPAFTRELDELLALYRLGEGP